MVDLFLRVLVHSQTGVLSVGLCVCMVVYVCAKVVDYSLYALQSFCVPKVEVKT